MGKGSKVPSTTTTHSTVQQSNLPEYARPYFEEILGRTSQLSKQPYEVYPAPRLAGFSDSEAQAFQGFANLASSGENPYLGQASGYSNRAANMAGDAGNYLPGQVTSGYTAGHIGTDYYDPNRVYSFMNPFQRAVTDIEMYEAGRRADIEGLRINDAAARASAFGGARHGLMESEHSRNTQRLLQEIMARGLRDNYAQAQRAAIGTFESDQGRALQAAQMNEDFQRMAAEMGMTAQQLTEQLGLQAAQNKTQAANILSQAAAQQTQLADLAQSQEIQRLTELAKVGATERALAQEGLDTQYETFVEQRDAPKEQLAFYSGILHGLPVESTKMVSVNQAAPNSLNQLLGLGIGAAGLI